MKKLILLCAVVSGMRGMESNDPLHGRQTMFTEPPVAYRDEVSQSLLATVAGTRYLLTKRAETISMDQQRNTGTLCLSLGENGDVIYFSPVNQGFFTRYDSSDDSMRRLVDSVIEKECLMLHGEQAYLGSHRNVPQIGARGLERLKTVERMRTNDLYLLVCILKRQVPCDDYVSTMAKEALAKTHMLWPPENIKDQVHSNSGYIEVLLALQYHQKNTNL